MSQTAVQTAPIPEPEAPAGTAPISDVRWLQAGGLPCKISVQAQVRGFTLKHLLDLRPQSIIRSQLTTSASPPLRVNGVVVAWCEFEVLSNRLAVRLTELA
jgi:flagellar motor switch/type III secretory pathway protein FliN